MIQKDIIKNIDCRDIVSEIPKESIDLLITSPPYWAKRIYSESGELGSEHTPEIYVKELADYFDIFEPYIKKEGISLLILEILSLGQAQVHGRNI